MTDSAVNDQDLVRAIDSIAASNAVAPGVTSAAGAVASPFDQVPASAPLVYGAPAAPAASSMPVPSAPPVDMAAPAPADNGPLAAIKKDALIELRPLVDKLSVSADEKFDTYLLLIRSTDDSNLIAPAYEAAKAITDDTRRAEALLDIIKEIDYLSRPKES
jgi:hypothetical protein